jgi:hypothetical protein
MTLGFATPEKRDQYLAIFSFLPALTATLGSLLSPLFVSLTSFVHFCFIPGKPFTSDDLWLVVASLGRLWMLLNLRRVEERGASSMRGMLRDETLTLIGSVKRLVNTIIKG